VRTGWKPWWFSPLFLNPPNSDFEPMTTELKNQESVPQDYTLCRGVQGGKTLIFHILLLVGSFAPLFLAKFSQKAKI
jgi:hypothetical protein